MKFTPLRLLIYVSLIVFFSSKNFCFSQEKIRNINSFEELIQVHQNMTTPEEVVMVWGTFNGYSKYFPAYKAICVGALDTSVYSKVRSLLGIKLFRGDMMVSNPVKASGHYTINQKFGDLIKCKIRLYRACKFPLDEIYFLVEDVY